MAMEARNSMKGMTNQTHERYSDPEIALPGSDRSFGLVMAAVFMVLTLVNVWHAGRAWPWTGAAAACLFAFALFKPTALRPFNWIWFKFGLLLHKVMNPVVMALVFFGAVFPTGLVMRAIGRDPLRLKWQPDANTYWIERQPPGPTRESMKDQF
jgi:hypothetical protein